MAAFSSSSFSTDGSGTSSAITSASGGISQLTMVNNILRRLREDTVTSVADNAYSQLIAIWINDAIRDVGEAYDWNSLHHVVNVDTIAGITDYDLSALLSAGGNLTTNDRATSTDSMLRFDQNGMVLGWIYDDDTSDVPNGQMTLISEDMRMRKFAMDRDDTSEDPTQFSLQMNIDGNGYMMRLYPAPSLVRRVRLVFNTPQAEMAIDGTDDDTAIIVPNPPVEAQVHMVAANERGEEIGEPGNLLEQRYIRVLGGAIEAAMAADARSDVYESRRD